MGVIRKAVDMRRASLGICVLLAVLALVTGCRHSIGPKTIARDQFDYAQSLRDAGKEQMLLNMVGLRYSEAPMFLKVTSVINQYSLEGNINVLSPPYNDAAAIGSPVGAGARFYDRPTLTYIPLSGAEFTKSVLTPIPPKSIMSLIQAGWRADLLMRLTVRSINGIAPTSRVGATDADPRFYELVSLMTEVQAAGGLSFRVEQRGDKEVALVTMPHDPDDGMQKQHDRIDEMLGIESDLQEYRLVFGQRASGPDEIAMLTHSILEMLVDLAQWIDVPPEHETSGRTRPTPDPEVMESFGFEPLIRVSYSKNKPEEAFVSIRYEGIWYWIPHDDFRSKRTLSFMQLMFSLAESGGGQQAPVVTVGAGGG
jgi:hypothetical protein